MPVTGKTILDAADIPQNSVIVPGNPSPVLMRGSTNVSTDNNNNTTTPVSFNLEQIGEVLFTLGQKIKDLSISVAIATDQIVSIQQSDLFATGVINAAQSAINGTPVAGASVILAVGQGQSSWKAQLLAGGGGFTAGTTMVVDSSPDGGTTWYSKSFKVAGVTPNNPQSSVVGPGPLELTGNAAGLTHIKVRCSVLNSTETINVRINGGAGVADVGLMGSLPSGQNNIGTLAPFVDGSVTGTVTNDNDTVAISCPGGQATALVNITGSFVGTLLFEGTPDGGTTWLPMNAVALGSSTVANQTTTTGAWRVNVSGLTSFHVKLHPTTSGTANIRINLSQGVHNVAVTNATKLGQDVMQNSAPVAFASDQSNLPMNLKTINGTTLNMATGDGQNQANMFETMLGIYAGGGQVDSTGKPYQAGVDRLAALQNKATQTGTITSTVAGDTALAFSAAPKTVMPGQRILLSGATSEYAVVSNSYVPSSSATSIPLQNALVQAGNTTAKWDIYSVTGPGNSNMLPTGLVPFVLAAQDSAFPGNFNLLTAATIDGNTARLVLQTGQGLYNGATIDRQRGNLDNISLLASAARTTTQNISDQINYNGRGLIVVLDMTNVAAGPSITLTIQGKDPVSGKSYTLLSGAAITTASTNVYYIYPGAAETANVSTSKPLPRTWNAIVTANNANSGTYSLGASVIV